MRIGLTGAGNTPDDIIQQATQAEADGFAAIWYPGAVFGDALQAIALAGRETRSIELGTAVLPTYLAHPVLMANRAAAVAAVIGAPGRFTLGVGPSHQPVVEGMLGLSYATPGRHTEEYVEVLTTLLRRERVSFDGAELHVHTGPPTVQGEIDVPVLVAALAPRLLRVAAERAAGTILWMANAAAIAGHVAPTIRKAAEAAGAPAPRIVAGLPVAVTDDVDAAREVAAKVFAVYGTLPNYQRILAHGGVSGPAEASLIGDEAAVTAQIEALFEAGATDLWAAPFPVGPDRAGSRRRTHELLRSLAAG
jgi:F420-dependent oxidoreductase-like protein